MTSVAAIESHGTGDERVDLVDCHENEENLCDQQEVEQPVLELSEDCSVFSWRLKQVSVIVARDIGVSTCCKASMRRRDRHNVATIIEPRMKHTRSAGP